MLDSIVKTLVVLQFNALDVSGQSARQDSNDEAFNGGSGEDKTFGVDDGDEWSGIDCDGEDTKDTSEAHDDRSSDGEDTC